MPEPIEPIEPEHAYAAFTVLVFGITVLEFRLTVTALVGDAVITLEPLVFEFGSIESGGPITPAGGSTLCAGQPGAGRTGIAISRLPGFGRYRDHKFHWQSEPRRSRQ